MVYAVEFSHRSGRDLVNMSKKRTNIVPIVEDARHPHKYRMLVPMVDTIFADVAQPDQARIVAINASYFLKTGGHFVISIKANCIDSTAEAEAVFAGEVKKMQAEKMKPQEQVTLEPYERDHAVVVGIYRPQPKKNWETLKIVFCFITKWKYKLCTMFTYDAQCSKTAYFCPKIKFRKMLRFGSWEFLNQIWREVLDFWHENSESTFSSSLILNQNLDFQHEN